MESWMPKITFQEQKYWMLRVSRRREDPKRKVGLFFLHRSYFERRHTDFYLERKTRRLCAVHPLLGIMLEFQQLSQVCANSSVLLP